MIIFTVVNSNMINNNINLLYKYSNFILYSGENCKYDHVILYDGSYCEYKKFKNNYIIYLYSNYLKNIKYFNYSGKRHREDGPAWILYDDNGKIFNKLYYINGKRHREGGPAWISYYKNGEKRNKGYYLYDKEYSYEDYLEELSCIQR